MKYHLHFGEPLHFSGGANEEDDTIAAKVAQVKRAIADLLAEGLRSRRGIVRRAAVPERSRSLHHARE